MAAPPRPLVLYPAFPLTVWKQGLLLYMMVLAKGVWLMTTARSLLKTATIII